MKLAELMRKGCLRGLATATVATLATDTSASLLSVATVARVAVATAPKRVATNDAPHDLSGWRVTGLEDASPATVARLHAASMALDKQIAAAGEGEPADPDQHCWLNDLRIDAAMNTAEIALFMRRHARLLALGFTDGKADRMADLLKERDREEDHRRACAECNHVKTRPCKARGPLSLTLLHHCAFFDRALP